jgi:hypothetical protein
VEANNHDVNHAVDENDDDKQIRFTIGGAGQRLMKEDFLKHIWSHDPKSCAQWSD